MWYAAMTVIAVACVAALIVWKSPNSSGVAEEKKPATTADLGLLEKEEAAIRNRANRYRGCKLTAVTKYGNAVASAMGFLSDEDIDLCESRALSRGSLDGVGSTGRGDLFAALEHARKKVSYSAEQTLREIFLRDDLLDSTWAEHGMKRHEDALIEVRELRRLWDSVGCEDVFLSVKDRVFGEVEYPLPIRDLKRSLELAKVLCGVDRDRFLADLGACTSTTNKR